MIAPMHRDFLDYYRLLKTSTARGVSVLNQFMNSDDLWNTAIGNMGFLQALYTGIDNQGVPADAAAYIMLNTVVLNPARHQASLLAYWNLLGLATESTVDATIANTTELAAIMAMPEAYAALLTYQRSFVTSKAAVLSAFNSAERAAAFLNTPYQIKALVENIGADFLPLKTIRENSTALANYKLHAQSGTSVVVPAKCAAVLVAVIGNGGSGGKGGYISGGKCCHTYESGEDGTAGSLNGTAGNRGASSDNHHYGAGGGGGAGGIDYYALKVSPGATLSFNNGNISGYTTILAKKSCGRNNDFQTFADALPGGGSVSKWGVSGISVHSGKTFGGGGTGGDGASYNPGAGTAGASGGIECYFAF